MLQVRISTQPTRLATTTRPATLEMHSQRAQVRIETEPAQLDIQQPEVRLSVDNSACREARGLYDSAGFSEVPGCSELSGAAGPSPPLQPANKPDAATIAAPFIKSRRVTFRLMVFSSFLRPQFIQCLKIHKIS